jgi:hypothetical protein
MSWVTSSLMLSIFILNSFISLFMVFSVSFQFLFRAPMIHLFVFVFSHIPYFSLSVFLECIFYILVDHV